MATKKGKKKTSNLRLPTVVRRLTSFLWGPGRPWMIAAAMVAALAVGWWGVWHAIGDEVLASDEYQVTAERIYMTPLPRWIKTDIRGEVFHDVILDGPLSIMAPDANHRLANACSLHAWVDRVNRVTKHHPARMEVDLSYRRPVCMVVVPGGMRPVDVRGILLPSGDFSSIEASRYPRLEGVDSSPIGPPGTRWGDERVVGAAEIADALGDAWTEMKLDRIVATERVASQRGSEYSYELFTRLGSRIYWGLAPNTRAPGEPTTEDKVARLKQLVAQYGSLEGGGGPQEIDLRDSQTLHVRDRLTRRANDASR